MVKKLMVVFFGAFAAIIVLAVVLLSGKMLLLRSPDGKTVYELRMHEGTLQHALRRGGVQLFSWSDIVLEDGRGRRLVPEQIGVAASNSSTGEYEVAGFPGGVRLFVRVTDSFVASAFYGLPAGETSERVEIRPEEGALGARFSDAAMAGVDERVVARPFIFVAPKADGGDTFLVYLHTEAENAKGPRPAFAYEPAALAPVKFDAETVYRGTPGNGMLHVLYFSDSPVLLREIYEAGLPSAPFPTLDAPTLQAAQSQEEKNVDGVPAAQ